MKSHLKTVKHQIYLNYRRCEDIQREQVSKLRELKIEYENTGNHVVKENSMNSIDMYIEKLIKNEEDYLDIIGKSNYKNLNELNNKWNDIKAYWLIEYNC